MMPAYLIATRCSNGWMVSADENPGGCVVRDNGRYCCSEETIREYGLGRQLDAMLARQSGGGTTTPTDQPSAAPSNPVAAVVDGIADVIAGKDPSSREVLYAAGTGKGTVVPDQAGVVPPSWFSQNWPYIAVGGIALTGVAAMLYFVTRTRRAEQ